MTLCRLLLRSLWRFRRTHLGVLLGIAVATTVITGALFLGDAMRYTLQRTADERLGQISHALIGGDRFFTEQLARQLGPDASGMIALSGVLSTPDGKSRAHDVAAYGIDDRFASLLGGPARPKPGEAILNTSLALQLSAKPGDTLVLRVPKPTALPIDAALVNASEPALALRITVAGIIDAENGGRFSLRAEQRTPMNLFVDHAWLADEIGVQGRLNVVLTPDLPGPIEVTLDDLELALTDPSDGSVQLQTPRVFIDASIEQDLAEMPGQRLLTYLVNTVAHGDRQSPYAMVTAANTLGDLALADNEIAINRWLADDLGANVGDTITLTYFLPDEGDRLVEAQAALTVARIVPIEGAFADRTLTPDFPGLAEADQLSRWDAGPAIDRSRIRDKDEAYWDDYRATPKAFINFATGQRLWANRFGTLTAIRFDASMTQTTLREHIDPKPLGFVARDVRVQAKTAAKGTVDFGQLFLSLSGFIIIAGVVLTATLFAMSVEQRGRQLGTLLAVGLTRRQVMALIIGEGGVIAIGGVLLGLLGGWGYASGVIYALSGIWSGAVAGTPIIMHARFVSILIGASGALVVCVLSMWLTLRALAGRPARELLSGAIGHVSAAPRWPSRAWLMAGAVFLGASLVLTIDATNRSGMQAGMVGFGAGAAAFIGLLLITYALLLGIAGTKRKATLSLSLGSLSIRNLTRRRSRTLAAIVTLGCGVFLVLAVSGFRLNTTDDLAQRASGTGGFALIVESSQPIRYDLNTTLGLDHYALSEDDLPRGSVVPLRVNGGDDASCLNLNQTATPRLLGVDPQLLASRQAFSFQGGINDTPDWTLLEQSASIAGAIPAITDANTAQWALKLAVGDTRTLADEQGQPFTIQLVATVENSILQGSLIIDERAFKRLFPSTSGHRVLLIDAANPKQQNEIATLLEEVLVDEGAAITTTPARLAQYNRVQNTYLTIFQALGGLGVVLGALGLGVIAARNLLERRAELALLSAVGLGRGRIASVALVEHGLLLGVGLSIGVLAAWIATLHTGPGLAGSSAASVWTLGAVLFAGLLAVALGLRSAWSRRLTESLRSD